VQGNLLYYSYKIYHMEWVRVLKPFLFFTSVAQYPAFLVKLSTNDVQLKKSNRE
jgi:hypothetical protein